MKIRIGQYSLENEIDCKTTMDGWEIFASAVNRLDIKPSSIHTVNGRAVIANWAGNDSIMIEY